MGPMLVRARFASPLVGVALLTPVFIVLTTVTAGLLRPSAPALHLFNMAAATVVNVVFGALVAPTAPRRSTAWGAAGSHSAGEEHSMTVRWPEDLAVPRNIYRFGTFVLGDRDRGDCARRADGLPAAHATADGTGADRHRRVFDHTVRAIEPRSDLRRQRAPASGGEPLQLHDRGDPPRSPACRQAAGSSAARVAPQSRPRPDRPGDRQRHRLPLHASRRCRRSSDRRRATHRREPAMSSPACTS